MPVLLIAAAAIGMLAARQVTSPTSQGYRVAIAAGPGGSLYAAGPEGLTVIHPDGTSGGARPAPAAISMAASGRLILVGADGGLYLSRDEGRSWKRAGVGTGRFLAVAASGRTLVAGAWAGSLFSSVDAGATWRRVEVPGGPAEFESITVAGPIALAATETGMLASTDGARTWTWLSGLPDRMTAVAAEPAGGFVAGDWRGRLYQSPDGVSWTRAADLGRGVWAIDGGWAATVSGLYDLASGAWAGPPFEGVEVTALAGGDGHLYAAVARGSVYGLVGGRWKPVFHP